MDYLQVRAGRGTVRPSMGSSSRLSPLGSIFDHWTVRHSFFSQSLVLYLKIHGAFFPHEVACFAFHQGDESTGLFGTIGGGL